MKFLNQKGLIQIVILVIVPAIISLLVSLLALTIWSNRNQAKPDVLVLPTTSGTAMIPELSEGEIAAPSAGGSTGGDTAANPPSEGCENPVHSVESGDTLGLISQEYEVSIEDIITLNEQINGQFDPDILSIGQTIVIPVCGIPSLEPTEQPTETPAEFEEDVPAPIPTATQPPLGPVTIRIEQVQNAGNLEEEAVIIINEGGNAQLEGWVLSNDRGDEFVFPPMTLFGGGAVTIHTAAGDGGPIDLYWGREEAVWRLGDRALLYNAVGELQHDYGIIEE
jgi:hypothetical protein